MGKNRNFYQNNEENIEVAEPVADEVAATESTPVEAPVVEEIKPAEPIIEVKVEPEVKKVEVTPAPAPVVKNNTKEVKVVKRTATL